MKEGDIVCWQTECGSLVGIKDLSMPLHEKYPDNFKLISYWRIKKLKQK